jgi:hypothetical protein
MKEKSMVMAGKNIRFKENSQKRQKSKPSALSVKFAIT